MLNITPCLWFDSQAEEAAKLYVDIFNGAPYARGTSKIKSLVKYPKAAEEVSGKKAGTVMTVTFNLDGQEHMALNGGPLFKFSEAFSLIVNCKDQDEIDYFWDALIANGGQASQCGWLKDKFGFSWQIAPENFEEMAKDPVKYDKAMAAILPMKKIIMKDLEHAANS